MASPQQTTTVPPAPARATRARDGAWVGAAVVALLSSGLYLATLAPGLGGTIDSAEFQHAAYGLSIVHPTGYPLYLLLGRGWITLLAAGNVAWRLNLLSALFAVAALLVVYATVLYLTGSPFGGVLAAGILGTHALVWETAVVAEVNSLNLLLVAASCYALLRWAGAGRAAADGPNLRRWPLEAVALIFGLCLSHHRTSALLLPAVLLFVVWMVRRGAPCSWASAARSLLLLLLPWLLYLYLPLRAATTAWYPNSWAGFAAEVGGTSAWPVILDTIQRPLLPRIGIIWDALFLGWAGTGAALLALAGLLLWARFPRLGWRAAGAGGPVVALYTLGFLAICGMMVIYDVDVIGDYLALAVLLAATWVGVAAAWALRAARVVASVSAGRVSWGAVALGLLVLLLPAAQADANYTPSDFSHYDGPRQFWTGIASWADGPHGMPAQSFVVGGWNRYNELRYLQTVEGWRPDLQPVVLDDLLDENRLSYIDDWLAQGRAVFLLDGTPDVLDHFAAVEKGDIWQLTRRNEARTVTLQHPLNITFGSNIRLLGYALEPEQPRPGGELQVTLFWQATSRIQERYVEFSHLVDDDLHKIGQKDDEPARGFRPTDAWTPGVTISDTLVMPIAPDAAPGTYRLIVGWYARIGEQRLPASDAAGRSLGDYWEMTPVRVAR